MTAECFETKCLAVIDQVHAKRQAIVITKHGKPVAKLIPANEGPDDIFDFFADKGVIVGDVILPVL